MAVRVLITGVTGFVGSHLAEYALAQGAEVWGSCRWRSKTENIDHLRDQLHLVECDLRDLSSVHHLVEQASPEYIVHLAAQSFVASSWHTPAETLYTNSISQVNLLETIRPGKTDAPRFLAIGSSEEYGKVFDDELPIKETNALRPLSPYAVSKVTQDLMGYQYFQSYGLPIIRTRAFNHEGPRRGDVFVTSNFARQVAEIEAGKRPPVIHVGNLKARRDYTDVRDIVRGYWRLLESGEPGEVYNLCSGRAWAIQEVLDFMLTGSRVRGIATKEDPARLRPSDVPVLLGDAGKIERTVGWRPAIDFSKTLADTLDYWRERT
ncbi:MAG: GDP-mannose 4,6-dehydratase [Candidatus Rokubacteria bacterium]|nr:GDP-mannose 4,6-dehydratase [Candidatus Rokubacteria bacterium]